MQLGKLLVPKKHEPGNGETEPYLQSVPEHTPSSTRVRIAGSPRLDNGGVLAKWANGRLRQSLVFSAIDGPKSSRVKKKGENRPLNDVIVKIHI